MEHIIHKGADTTRSKKSLIVIKRTKENQTVLLVGDTNTL